MRPLERARSLYAGVSLVGVVGAIVLLVLAFNVLTAFHSTAPGEVCVVQEGGPLDGRGVAEVRQAGEGVKNIGIFNKQRCFPPPSATTSSPRAPTRPTRRPSTSSKYRPPTRWPCASRARRSSA